MSEIISKPIELLNLVWDTSMRLPKQPWQTLNYSMRKALYMTISAGWTFKPGDFTYIAGHYNSWKWIGEGREDLYAIAVEASNTSAVTAYEQDHGRIGLIADNVRPRERSAASEFLHRGPDEQKSGRLAVGLCFPWRGEDVKVTSFTDGKGEDTAVVACSHDDGRKHYGKVVHRFTITRADIIAERKERKEARKQAA